MGGEEAHRSLDPVGQLPGPIQTEADGETLFGSVYESLIDVHLFPHRQSDEPGNDAEEDHICYNVRYGLHLLLRQPGEIEDRRPHEGDRIVVAGQASLKDGALVRLPGDPDPDEETDDGEDEAES